MTFIERGSFLFHLFKFLLQHLNFLIKKGLSLVGGIQLLLSVGNLIPNFLNRRECSFRLGFLILKSFLIGLLILTLRRCSIQHILKGDQETANFSSNP